MSDICKLCGGAGYTYEPEYYEDGSVSRTVTQVPCSCSEVATDGVREALQGWPTETTLKRYDDRIEELETICAEAYQVVGLFSDFLPDAKLLDNLSQQKLVHTDVLPFTAVGIHEPRKVDWEWPELHQPKYTREELVLIISEPHSGNRAEADRIINALIEAGALTVKEQPK